MTHRGRYNLRRIVKAAIDDSGGEITEKELLTHLTSLGYHGPSIKKILPILDPGIIYEDGLLRFRE